MRFLIVVYQNFASSRIMGIGLLIVIVHGYILVYRKFAKNETILSGKLMKKQGLYAINEHFEEILRSKMAIIADSL